MARSAEAREILRAKALDAAKEQVKRLLDLEFPDAFDAYENGLVDYLEADESADPNKFKFSLSVAVVIHPKNGDVAIGARSSFGTRHKAETPDAVVSANPELPFEKEKAKK